MMNDKDKTSFAEATLDPEPGLLREIWLLLKRNKKYWLIPLIASLLIFGLLVVLGGSAAAPFIYTLF